MVSQFVRVVEDAEFETSKPLGKIGRLLARLLPHANPDFEHVYPQVRWWWLEIREGTPIRELGFSAEGRIVVLGPFQRNYGLWTDSEDKLDPEEYEAVEAEDFERHWNQAVREHHGRT